MKFPLQKVHTIATLLSVATIFISVVVLFLYIIDDGLDWDIFPRSWQVYVSLVGWLVGTIAIGSTLTSIVLSLYEGKHHP